QLLTLRLKQFRGRPHRQHQTKGSTTERPQERASLGCSQEETDQAKYYRKHRVSYSMVGAFLLRLAVSGLDIRIPPIVRPTNDSFLRSAIQWYEWQRPRRTLSHTRTALARTGSGTCVALDRNQRQRRVDRARYFRRDFGSSRWLARSRRSRVGKRRASSSRSASARVSLASCSKCTTPASGCRVSS